jgi:hypothetical protein
MTRVTTATTSTIRDRFTMYDIVTAMHVANGVAARNHPFGRGELEFARSSTKVKSLNVETVISNPFLPANRKWAVRFDAGGTVTIVLGMRVYAMGWFTTYFAGLVATRLGVPLRRVRLYYSVTLPAALHTPISSHPALRRRDIGPVARAAADVIEGLCDQVIERGRFAFATVAGVDVIDVGFDQLTCRFFVLDMNRGRSVLELAEIARTGSSVSAELATKLQRSDNRSFAE